MWRVDWLVSSLRVGKGVDKQITRTHTLTVHQPLTGCDNGGDAGYYRLAGVVSGLGRCQVIV